MSEQANMPARLREGIDAAKRGDRATARRLLLQVLGAEPGNEIALMWMASVVDTDNERRFYLERALQTNPNNARAREALRRLGIDQPYVDRAATTSGGGSRAVNAATNIYLIAAAVVAVVVIGVVVVALLSSLNSGTSAQPTPDVQATFSARLIPTETPNITRAQPTETILPGIVVTLDTSLFTPLPPTFTPTFTAEPTETPPPTATPLPLDTFTLIYSDYEDGAAAPSLYRASADGSNEVKLESGEENGGFKDVAIDPAGERIAFVRDIEYDNGDIRPQIFVAPLNALDEARYVSDLLSHSMSHPAWSPDGSKIVFAIDHDDNGGIWMVEADNGHMTRLTDNDAQNFDPSFSPDGETILFASDVNSPGFSEIYTMNIDGSNVTQLTDDALSSYSPVWSPDGTRIAFISDRGGDGDVYVMDANGQRPFLLTQDDNGAEDRTPSWSPDSQWIVFASNRQFDRFRWYAVNLQGEVEPVTQVDRNPQSVSFSTR